MHTALSKMRTLHPPEINNSFEGLGVRMESQPHERYPSRGGRTAKTKEPNIVKGLAVCKDGLSPFPGRLLLPHHLCSCECYSNQGPLQLHLFTDCGEVGVVLWKEKGWG